MTKRRAVDFAAIRARLEEIRPEGAPGEPKEWSAEQIQQLQECFDAVMEGCIVVPLRWFDIPDCDGDELP
jgi:hypothetical protein